MWESSHFHIASDLSSHTSLWIISSDRFADFNLLQYLLGTGGDESKTGREQSAVRVEPTSHSQSTYGPAAIFHSWLSPSASQLLHGLPWVDAEASTDLPWGWHDLMWIGCRTVLAWTTYSKPMVLTSISWILPNGMKISKPNLSFLYIAKDYTFSKSSHLKMDWYLVLAPFTLEV